MSNLQTFNIATSQFIKSNSAWAKSPGNGFRITGGVTCSSWWVTFLLTKVPLAKWVPGLSLPLFFLAGIFGVGVGYAENFIRLRVESFSLQRQQKKKKKKEKKRGISQSLYKRKVVKGRLCMGTRGSTLRLHSATQGLRETAWCSERSLAISAGNCGSAGKAQGDRNRRWRGSCRDAGRTLRPLTPSCVLVHPLAFREF